MSGGETNDVATYATEPNQCIDSFNTNFSFDEILLVGEKEVRWDI